MKLFQRSIRPETVDFCDRCGSVCDAACRRSAARERSIDRAVAARLGLR